MPDAALCTISFCRFVVSEINREVPEHDPEKWIPVFRKDHAPLEI
jgi:hypothetical protein